MIPIILSAVQVLFKLRKLQKSNQGGNKAGNGGEPWNGQRGSGNIDYWLASFFLFLIRVSYVLWPALILIDPRSSPDPSHVGKSGRKDNLARDSITRRNFLIATMSFYGTGLLGVLVMTFRLAAIRRAQDLASDLLLPLCSCSIAGMIALIVVKTTYLESYMQLTKSWSFGLGLQATAIFLGLSGFGYAQWVAMGQKREDAAWAQQGEASSG